MKSVVRYLLIVLSYASPFFFFFLLSRRFEYRSVMAFFVEADGEWLVLGFFVVPLSLFLHSLSWKVLLLPTPLPFSRLFFALSQSAMAEQILPFRMNEGIKVYYLGVEEGVGKTRVLSAILSEEMAVGGSKILFFILLMWGGSLESWMYWGIWGYSGFVLGLVFSFRWIIRSLQHPSPPPSGASLKARIHFHIRNWLYQMHAVKNHKHLTLVVVFLFLKMCVEVVIFYSVSRALGVFLTLHQTWLVLAALHLTLLVMVTPGHYGLLEGISMVVLNSFGIPLSQAFAVSVAYHLVLSASLIAIGVATRIFHGEKKRGKVSTSVENIVGITSGDSLS